MKKALICMPIMNDEYKARFLEAGGDCELIFKAPKELTAADFDGVDAAVGAIPAGFLHEQPLEFVQLSSAGADAHVKPGLLRRDTVLCCCTGAYSQTVAEHGLASTLAMLKKLHIYRDDQRNHVWGDAGTTGTIDGATVLVMCLGDIGKYYARMAKALGAYVIGVKRTAGEKPDCVDELYTTDRFEEIAGRADIIFSVMPSTPETVHFYTAERFAMMKKSAIFINCGRGTAVDMAVLYDVLKNGVIDSAAVDVFETEPLPAESPLWELENLFITPHASGFFHLPATYCRVLDICLHNLKAWLGEGGYMNVVDYNTGYKK